MAVEIKKDTISFNQVISQKNETVIIEGDSIVPDVKPDVLNIINSNGTVCIYKKEVLDGKVKIEGSINVYVLYIADSQDNSDTVRSIQTSLDFSQSIQMEKAKSGMNIEEKVILKNLEGRVLNGRKINLRAILQIDAKVLSNENAEYINQFDNIPDLQKQNRATSINSLIGVGSTKTIAKDTIMIDNSDNLAEIMKSNIRIIGKDTKVSYNKILAKAEVEANLMYLTEDSRVATTQKTIPIMGFIDIPQIEDDSISDVNYEIKNVVIKPNGVEEHSIYIEIEVEIDASVYTTKEVEIVEDLYSPIVDLSFKQRNIQAIEQKRTYNDIFSIREKQTDLNIGQEKLYDVEVIPIINTTSVEDGNITYEGDIHLNFFFSRDNLTSIDKREIVKPFKYIMSCEGLDRSSSVETNMEVRLNEFTILPDESIDMKIDINFLANTQKNINIRLIDSIEKEEVNDDKRFSFVIYFVKPGDTLWKIAKKFRTTVDDIARVNGIENPDKIEVGRQLFIPRYVRKTEDMDKTLIKDVI